MDGVHRTEDEAEEEERGGTREEGDSSHRVRSSSICFVDASRSGAYIDSTYNHSAHLCTGASYQAKTLDHKPPMSQADFDAYATPWLSSWHAGCGLIIC